MIKNPGGTIVPCGGYVAGRKKWVEAAAARLSAPGLGVDCGSTPGDIMRTIFQGLFLSPQMVGEAIKVTKSSSLFILFNCYFYPQGRSQTFGFVESKIEIQFFLK